MCYISYICGMYELYIPYLLLIIAIKMLLVAKEKNYKKSKKSKNIMTTIVCEIFV